ncbi:MAG: thioredoxin domain-containing protein [Bacteroidetes bacterium]|nr:thioredoxin domain-containing protein [Bacteroidota bacterium]
MKKPNALINSSSPYLLQHAYNPVNWFPWGEEALQRAAQENKLLLISIGYSACHWCHVMEHESFEDESVAEIMNANFICIKVDREERPDIDQVYMSAVQLLTGRGGWPLNCFALPDGKPVYGGTYFPKSQWMNVLLNLSDGYKNDQAKFYDYASQLTDGIKQEDLFPVSEMVPEFAKEVVESAIQNWHKQIDMAEGGPNRAPKFPLPNNYHFLLNYTFYYNDNVMEKYLKLTLKKMAYGGIYDQIAGGFSRYSVDHLWKVPHFEKMLYDNAQLISLYSNAFKRFGDPLYQEIVEATVHFVNHELKGDFGNYFSALDADSEGEEGKYYVWTKDELMTLAGDDFAVIESYYNINETGYWEHGNYILLRKKDDDEIAEQFHISKNQLKEIVNRFKNKAMLIRSERIPPGLDDKTLISWNALMVTSLIDAHQAFDSDNYLDDAITCVSFLMKHALQEDGSICHTFKNGKSTISGFLEDYAFLIQALVKCYESTFDNAYLEYAKQLLEYCVNHFHDPNSGFFYFTSDKDSPLIARKFEIQDNVIASSNSQMAINLFQLGRYFENDLWIEMSGKMVSGLEPKMVQYGSAFSNWLNYYLMRIVPSQELIITGPEALAYGRHFTKKFFGSAALIGGTTDISKIPLITNRNQGSETLIYLCENKVCNIPYKTVEEAILKLKENKGSFSGLD